MTDLILSIRSNNLKILSYVKNEYKTLSVEVPNELVSNTRIVDPEGFSNFLLGILSANYPHYKKAGLNFVIEPSELILKYITLGKNGETPSESYNPLIAAVTEALGNDYNLDDLYYKTKKLAPFVYQFIGIKKDLLETYLKISDLTDVALNSLVPWVLLLPEFTKDSNAALYIYDNGSAYNVTVSELLGVYFSEEYSKEMAQDELKKTVDSLATFKRAKPITKVYKLNAGSLDFAGNYEVLDLRFEGAEFENYAGFEILSLVLDFFENRPEFLGGHTNLLNYLPLPDIVRGNKPMVVASSVMAGLLLLVGGWYFYWGAPSDQPNTSQLANGPEPTPTVLAENVQSSESAKPEENKPELKKADLKVKVENGSGVAGVAGKTSDKLKGLGYTMVDPGNADEDRKGTLIQIKESKKDYQDLIKKDLQDADVELTVKTDLAENSEFDVLVVVGS